MKSRLHCNPERLPEHLPSGKHNSMTQPEGESTNSVLHFNNTRTHLDFGPPLFIHFLVGVPQPPKNAYRDGLDVYGFARLC